MKDLIIDRICTMLSYPLCSGDQGAIVDYLIAVDEESMQKGPEYITSMTKFRLLNYLDSMPNSYLVRFFEFVVKHNA